MSNDLIIRISAIDKATAIVRKVNDSVSQSLRPVMELQRSVAALGKEAGLGRMGKALGGVATAASDVAAKVGSILAPLTAVVGIGSIAAIGELAKKWGDVGSEVLKTTANIGVGARELQELRGAAELADVSAGALTGGLKSLGDTLQDSLAGRNNEALMLMNRLGITIKKNADGAVDSTAAFSALAERIASIKNPQVQALIARTFGLEESLPLLRKGKEGIAELVEQVRKQGLIMDGPALQAAESFRQSMKLMSLSLENVRNTIGNALLPILQPLIGRITTWVMANRDLIATRVSEFVQALARALANINWNGLITGIKSVVSGVVTMVEWFGGWKSAAWLVVAVMSAPLLGAVISLGGALFALSGVLATVTVWMSVGLLQAMAAAMLKMAVMTATTLPALSSAFLSAGGFIETGLIAKIGALAVNVALLGAAAAVGYAIGSVIYKSIEGTELADKIGRFVTTTLAAFGNKEAQATLEAELNAKAGLGGPVSPVRKAAQIAAATEQHVTGSAPTRGIRNNNPGNLNFVGQAGATKEAGPNGRFAVFGTMQEGIAALGKQLETYQARGQDTTRTIISKYAPASDNNNTTAYIDSVAKKLGVSADAHLDFKNPALLKGMITAITDVENGKGKVGERQIDEGLQLLYRSGGVPTYLAGGLNAPPAPAQATPYGPSAQTAQATPYGPSAQTAQATPAGAEVTVHVDFSGVPHGAKTRVQTRGAIVANTKIGYAMPEFGIA